MAQIRQNMKKGAEGLLFTNYYKSIYYFCSLD
jgi:hypothetical protein